MDSPAYARHGTSDSPLGALQGLRVLEISALGPVPCCAMLLADHGAEVVRIERPGAGPSLTDGLGRGRQRLVLDLKQATGQAELLELCKQADVLIEGFRPGVMERLGLGPTEVAAVAPHMVYGRMTGWGQSGALAHRAGHDLNYLAMSGLLWPMGDSDRPPAPPLNLVADFGSGAMMLAFGVLAAVLRVRAGGQGQVVDAAMVRGTAYLGTLFHSLQATGQWQWQRSSNLLDGGAPFYACYAAQDGYVSVAALEPAFFAELIAGLELDAVWIGRQYDRAYWPELRRIFSETFAAHPRAYWDQRLLTRDACYAPVLEPDEAATHPWSCVAGQENERGVWLPQPEPMLSVTPAQPGPSACFEVTTQQVLDRWTQSRQVVLGTDLGPA